MMSQTDIYESLSKFRQLPNAIIEFASRQQFIDQWKKVFGSSEARDYSNIVYMWLADKPVPRLKGSSKVIYIGRTKTTLYARHGGNSTVESNESHNGPRYKHILEYFGPIRVYFAGQEVFGDIKTAEAILLESYFRYHLEYPPINGG